MPPEPSSPSGLPSRCGRVCEQDVHSGALTKIQGTFGAAMYAPYFLVEKIRHRSPRHGVECSPGPLVFSVLCSVLGYYNIIIV